MYIRKSSRIYKGKTYTNHLLVESILTAKGPRQRVICSLGNLEPAPGEDWLALAHKLESALRGQKSLEAPDAATAAWIEKARRGGQQRRTEGAGEDASVVAIDTSRVETEEHREAGPVHAGHSDVAAVGAG